MILNYYAIVNNRPPAPRSEDGSTGGGWGEECRAVRAWKPRRSAQKILGRNRAEISLSFFEFFSGDARKRKIVREIFCEVAAGALAEVGGEAVSSVQKMFEQSCIIPFQTKRERNALSSYDPKSHDQPAWGSGTSSSSSK